MPLIKINLFWLLFEKLGYFLLSFLVPLSLFNPLSSFANFQVYMEPLKKVQVEGFLMFAEPEVLFGNLDELCCVSTKVKRCTYVGKCILKKVLNMVHALSEQNGVSEQSELTLF